MDTTGERKAAVARQIERLFVAGTVVGLTDGQLLDLFVSARSERAETAFETLMIRHGPTVLRVCRGILDDPHDAEDAFQATFLILARRPGSVRNRDSIASWLHGVARRVAVRSRVEATRRRFRERRAAEVSPSTYETRPDFGAVHEEIDRLSASLREPVILCYLEGMTYDTAAARLGVTEGTIRGRLARARDRLRSSLTRRGLGSFPACLAPTIDLLPPSLVTSVVQAVSGLENASPTVVGLAERTIRTMRWTQLGKALAGVGLVSAVALGTTALAMRPAEQAPVAVSAVEVKEAPLVRTLSDGTTVEMVAVSEGSMLWPKDAWWTPNGTVLATPPYVKRQFLWLNPWAGKQSREFVIRIRGIDKATAGFMDDRSGPLVEGLDSGVQWECDQAHAINGRADFLQGDRGCVPGLRLFCLALPASLARVNVRVGVMPETWKTLATCQAKGSSSQAGSRLGQGFNIAFGKPHVIPQGTTISLGSELQVPSKTRLVAVDLVDREHVAFATSDAMVGGVHLSEFEFKVSPERIKEFRFQTRPIEWVTFDDVALSPKKD